MWTNWTDGDDIPVTEFVRLGIGALRDPESRSRLSDYIRSSGSTVFYRHYHPPMAFYPVIALRPFLASLPLQWQLRVGNLVWLLLWTLALALIGWRCAAARTPAAILVPVSAAWAMAVVGFNTHVPFGLTASLFFFVWYLYELEGRLWQKRVAQLLLAASFATVAYGMFLLFAIALRGLHEFWTSGEKARLLRSAAASAGWTLLFLALLWPGGVFGLGLLKNWVFTIYIALFRLGGEPAAFAGWWTLLIEKWNANPLELLFLLFLLGVMFRHWRDTLRRSSHSAAVVLLLILLYLQINPALVYRWYLFPAFAIGFLLFGHAAVIVRLARHQHTETRLLPIAVATAAIMFIAASILVEEPDYSELRQIHRIIDAQQPAELIIPRSLLPQLRPYHPHTPITSHHDIAYGGMSLSDSLPTWTKRALVILPKPNTPHSPSPDVETEGYSFYRLRR
jgi:hypothetical protein